MAVSNSLALSTTTSPILTLTYPRNTTTRPSPPRRSSSLHAELLTKLRPLPFQYVWSVWHSKPAISASPSESYTSHLTLLATTVPDIATFYRIFNNIPWADLALKHTVYIFRTGVKPLWEDPENLCGGAWVVKVRREDGRALRVWEEMCLLVCGGELQAAISSERDHVLGLSYSARLYWAHISIWTKKGSNLHSIELLEQTMLERISPDLRPRSRGEYYYKQHSGHDGWQEAIAGAVA